MTTPTDTAQERRARRAAAYESNVDGVIFEVAATARDGWFRFNSTTGGRAVAWVCDWFFGRLFRNWGPEGTTQWAPERPPTAKEIEARVDAAMAAAEAKKRADAEQAMKERQQAAEATRQHDAPAASVAEPLPADDTRPSPEPQDLDHLALSAPPDAAPTSPQVTGGTLHIEADDKWCICGHLASECGHVAASTPSRLDIGPLSPPPSVADSPQPATP